MGIEGNDIFLAVIGAILGVIATKAYNYIRYLIKLVSPHYLTGKWYSYYLIMRNYKEFMGSEDVEIKRGKLNQFDIKINAISFEQSYTGYGYEESNFLLFNYKPKKHFENIFVRYEKRIAGIDEILLGLWSAWDFDGKAAVGPTVLSRNELSEDEVRKHCSKIDTFPKIRCMRIP